MVNHVNFISVMREGILSVKVVERWYLSREMVWCTNCRFVIRLQVLEERNTMGTHREVKLEKTYFVGALIFLGNSLVVYP